MKFSRLFSRSLAEQGERLAAKHLKRHGYKILARNLWLGTNEIDVVAQCEDTVAFVEVKTRRSDAVEDPAANVDHAKQRAISKAARMYIAQRDDPTLYYRFDIVAVVLPEGGVPTITWYKDAFRVG